MEIGQALIFIALNALMISFIFLAFTHKAFDFVFFIISALFSFIITAFLLSNPILPSIFNGFVVLLYLGITFTQIVYSIFLIKGD